MGLVREGSGYRVLCPVHQTPPPPGGPSVSPLGLWSPRNEEAVGVQGWEGVLSHTWAPRGLAAPVTSGLDDSWEWHARAGGGFPRLLRLHTCRAVASERE